MYNFFIRCNGLIVFACKSNWQFVYRRFLRRDLVVLKRTVFHRLRQTTHYRPTGLTAEPVEGTALTLQRVDDIHGSDRLALGVLRVGDGIADDVLEEDLQNAAGLFVDQTRNTLHASTTSQSTNGWLRDALDVVTQHLPVTLGTSLAQSFASFSSARHASLCICIRSSYDVR